MMMQHTDSVMRAADALLTERYGQQKRFTGRSFIVRGYTADVVEQALLPVTQPLGQPASQAAVWHVAA